MPEADEKNNVDLKNETVQAAIAEAVEQEVSKLKSNRDAILSEKKLLADKLQKFGDIDPNKITEMMTQIAKSEEAQLIADNKMDELIDKRTSAIREKADDEVAALTSQLSEMTGKYDTVNHKYNRTQIDRALQDAAISAGIRPEAISDVLARGAGIFSLAEDGAIEARDSSGELVKEEGLILDPNKYVASLKKLAPHFWPPSVGAGATGGDGNSSDLESRIDAAAVARDMTLYRKLRDLEKSTT